MFIFYTDSGGNSVAVNAGRVVRIFQSDKKIYMTVVDDEVSLVKDVSFKAVEIFAGSDAEVANKKMRQFYKAVSNGVYAFYFGGE